MKRLTPKKLHPYDVKNFVNNFNDKGDDPYFRSKVIDKLWKYENAQEQGLLVSFPIAIGGVIWEIIQTYQKDYNTRETKKNIRIEAKYVLGFEILPCEKYVVIDNPHYDEKKNLDELGKTIFLTETEALQALEKECSK